MFFLILLAAATDNLYTWLFLWGTTLFEKSQVIPEISRMWLYTDENKLESKMQTLMKAQYLTLGRIST